MGQRSKFLLLLRPLPGQMAGKGKGVQRKLTHNQAHSKGRQHFATKSAGRTSQNTTRKHHSIREAPKQQSEQQQRVGQPRSGDPGLGHPPPFASNSPAYKSQRQHSDAERIRNSKPPTNSRQSSVCPPRMVQQRKAGVHWMKLARHQRDAQNGTKQ